MLQYEFVTHPEKLSRIADAVVRASVVGLDIETTSLEPLRGKIRLLQLLVPGEENGGRGRIYVVDLFETKGLGPIEAALRDTKAIFAIHNSKFEQKWFWWHYRLRLWPVFCTFRASALIYNGKKGLRHDLDSVVSRELNEQPVNVGQGGSDWSGALTPRQLDYAAEDVLRLANLRTVLRAKLTEYGLLTAALVEFGVILAEGRTELNGLPLNREKWLALAEANGVERARMREELLDLFPHPKGQLGLPGMSAGWNVDSPVQVLESLRKLGLKVQTTNAIELAQHAKKSREVRKLLAYRHVAQLVKTYGRTFLRHVDEDGRIRPDYYGMLVTGRYSANKSMQQIPRGTDFRACFEAPEGRRLVGGDYNGVEMRMCAEISGDEALIRVFRDGEDVHRATASAILGVAPAQVTKEQRQQAKPTNFGFCVAAGQRVLTHKGLIPIEDVERWHKVWDGVEWVTHEGVIFQGWRPVVCVEGLWATSDHEVYTDDGRKVSIGDIASEVCDGRIAIGGVGENPVRYTAFDRAGGAESAESQVCGDILHVVRESSMGACGQYSWAKDEKLCLPEEAEVPRYASADVGSEVRYYSSAVRERHACVFPPLQGSRYQKFVRVSGGFYSVGARDVPSRRFQRQGFRSDRQQWALRVSQSAIDDVQCEYTKQGVLAPVYDILHAGPRHRFTVEGKVVSNCYGMSPPTFVLYAMANYGVLVSLPQAKRYRQKYFERYAGVAQWHRRVLRDGPRQGFSRTLSGRIRYLDPTEAHNEYLNTPVQGSSADALKTSLAIVQDRLDEQFGITPARTPDGPVRIVHHVHDEILLEADDSAEMVEQAEQLLHDGMKKGMEHFMKRVPVVVDPSNGRSWAEVH